MGRVRRALKKIFEDNEYVTFFPTYGYRKGGDWIIPLRVWVHEPRKLVETVGKLIADKVGATTDRELMNFTDRFAHIVADSESREQVVFRFENDPEGEEWMIRSENGKNQKSDLNGIVNGFIRLGHNRAQSLMNAQNEGTGWLTIRAVSDEHSGSGRIRLLEPKGVSVISDIDDTIKITEIPKGGKVVVKNTFFKDFTAAPKMEGFYNSFDNASFHYVSGAPWQLYRPIANFMEETYPEGTYHMKNVPTNLLSPTTWKDLLKLTGDATIDQKLVQITEIIKRFPDRQFILVGDSGEHDPEVYRQLRNTFPKQVGDIWIRDVVKAQDFAPERLTGMNIIAA